jgi:parallel beta helix pectate lyase-like protein
VGFQVVFAAAALLFSPPPPPATGTVAPGRDDTASLQTQLDAGGLVFLPRLEGGECYATHGLWVSLDGTQIISDGACIVALGPGPVRLRSPDGDPIAADAIFFVNRSSDGNATPHGVTIAGLTLVVPRSASMYGIEIYAHDVAVERVRVQGDPIDSLLIGGRGNGEGYSSGVRIADSTFTGGTRNVVSVTSVRGLTIERCVISGASDTNYLAETGRSWGNPAAGIDLEPNSTGDSMVGVRIDGNRIEGNAGPGILLAFPPAPVEAPSVRIVDNRIAGNGLKPTPPVLGGIVATGSRGGVTVEGNQIVGNNGPSIVPGGT